MTTVSEAMNHCWDTCWSEHYKDSDITTRAMSRYIGHLEALVISLALKSDSETEVSQKVMEIAESLKATVSSRT